MVQSQEFYRPPLRRVLEAYVSVTAAAYTAKGGDRLIGVNRAGAVTITLPTAQLRLGRTYTIKDESGAAATNNITVATEGSETIDGVATDTIGENYGSKTYYSDRTNWFTVPLLAAASHSLASHSSEAHSELSGVGTDDHHAQAHTLASHSSEAHSELTGVGTDDHHAQSHTLDSHTGTLQHEKGGLEADVNAGDGFIEIKAGTTTVIKSNTAATAAPGATDDSAAGYAVGSVWIDTTNDKAYVCLDSTATAAVWTEITQAGGGGGALTREGGQTTEATTTSTTAVDLLSAASLTIGATEPFELIGVCRVSAGHIGDAACGLKLNATVLSDPGTADDAIWRKSNSVDEAQEGGYWMDIAARVTNYLTAIGGTFRLCQTDGDFLRDGFAAQMTEAAVMPTAQITDVVIRAILANAAMTLGADELQIYSKAAS